VFYFKAHLLGATEEDQETPQDNWSLGKHLSPGSPKYKMSAVLMAATFGFNFLDVTVVAVLGDLYKSQRAKTSSLYDSD
jgi:hypothetical protein